MTPLNYYLDYVEPALRDAIRKAPDVRSCKLACEALHHFLDYWALAHGADPAKMLGQKDVDVLRKYLADTDSEYALVRDIADAHKHAQIRRPSLAGNANDVAAETLMWDEMDFGTKASGYVGTIEGPHVVVRDNCGTPIEVIDLIYAVDGKWRQWLGLSARSLESLPLI